MATNDQHALNVAFAAVCHPFVCAVGDEFLSVLRLLCKDSRLAADAERKRVQICLPDAASGLQPSPEHIRSLLSHLLALAHVSIYQDSCPPEPSRSRDRGSHPGGSPHNAHAPAPRLQLAPTRLPPCCSYWRTALSALRPQHLRSLQLDGLVLLLLLPPSLRAGPGTDTPEPRSRGGEDRPCGAPSRTASRPPPLCPSSPSPGPGTRSSDSPELLADLLAAAPGLQELSLQRVRVLVLREAHAAGAGAAVAGAGADGTEAEEDSLDSAVDAAAAWCPVLRALPPGLTTLRLRLSPSSSLSAPRAGQPGGGGPGSVAAAAGASWYLQSCPCRCPCPGCLGGALRRLPRLTVLELSGMVPADVVAALTAATRASADAGGDGTGGAGGGGGGGGYDGGPEVPPLEVHVETRGQSAAAVAGTPAAGPSPSSAAAATAASSAPSAAGAKEHGGEHGQGGREEQRRQEPPQPLPADHHYHHQPVRGPPLARLERLVLDLEGHVDMEALRAMVAGLPELNHLALVERAAAAPGEGEEEAGAVRRALAAAELPAGGASPGPRARPAGVIPIVAGPGCVSWDGGCSPQSGTTGGTPEGLLAAGGDGAPDSPGGLPPPGAATPATLGEEVAPPCPSSPPPPQPKYPPARTPISQQLQTQRQQPQQHQQQPLSSLCPLDAMLWMLRRPDLRRLSFTSDRSFTTLEPPLRAAPAPAPMAAAAAVPAAPLQCVRAAAAASSARDVATAAGQEVGPWRPGGVVRSNADGGTFGTAALGGGGGGGGSSGVGWSGAGSSSGGPCLSAVRLSFDLSAEALEPLVASLPYTVTSLTLQVGTLHRPADVLAAYVIAADERAQKEAAEAEAEAAEAVVAEGTPRAPAPVCDSVTSASAYHQHGGRPSPTVAVAAATSTPAASAAASTATPSRSAPGSSSPSAPPPPPPAAPRPYSSPFRPTTASPSAAPSASSSLPSGPDSPAWLSIPPHSFLGGMRFLWPALTQLPRVLPRLQELRLGGGAAAACSDHVLRCWAGASGDPDSLATPMVVDPSFNALMRVPGPDPQPVRQGPGPGGPGGRADGGRGGGEGPRGAGEGFRGTVRGAEPPEEEEEEGVAGLGRGPQGRVEGAMAAGGPQGGDFAPTEVGAAGGRWGSGPGVQGGGVMAWSEWSRSLERVCLMAPGPTVAGALHLRRFMTGLRRLQVVVDGRLTDVAVAGGRGEGGGGSGERR